MSGTSMPLHSVPTEIFDLFLDFEAAMVGIGPSLVGDGALRLLTWRRDSLYATEVPCMVVCCTSSDESELGSSSAEVFRPEGTGLVGIGTSTAGVVDMVAGSMLPLEENWP